MNLAALIKIQPPMKNANLQTQGFSGANAKRITIFVKMKKYILILILIAVLGPVYSQQLPNYTMYMMNPFIYNPALAGTANFYQIRTNHRFQWVGFKDPPITNAISAFGPHRKKSMGFGGTVFNDVTGPISRTGGNAIYAYNFAVTVDMRVSLGLSVGLLQYKIDGTKIETYVPNDPALPNAIISRLIPDASVGVYAYSTNYYFGFSANQLLNNAVTKKSTLETGDVIGLNKLKSHFYLMGGYIFEINREWDIEPGVVISKMAPSPFQAEIFCKGIFQNFLWGGLTFRTADAASIAIGYTHEKKIFIGYSVDLAINDIRKYSYGSHEIFIGYNFDKIKKISRK